MQPRSIDCVSADDSHVNSDSYMEKCMFVQRGAKRGAEPSKNVRADEFTASRQVYLFETRKNGLLRTAGVVLLQGVGFGWDLPREVADACVKMALARTDAAARGKVAVLGDRELRVLQADGDGQLQLALCGNATAAAILVSNKSDGELEVEGPGGSRITSAFHRAGNTISQSWLLPSMQVSDFTWRGRRCARVSGLNSYFVICGGLPVGMAAETCRLQLAEGQLNAKLAVFGHGAAQNHVVFFNASGQHGAAPMTGLASIAVAAHALPHFATRISAPIITYQTVLGSVTYALPPVGRAEDGRLLIALPDVEAYVSPLSEVTR